MPKHKLNFSTASSESMTFNFQLSISKFKHGFSKSTTESQFRFISSPPAHTAIQRTSGPALAAAACSAAAWRVFDDDADFRLLELEVQRLGDAGSSSHKPKET